MHNQSAKPRYCIFIYTFKLDRLANCSDIQHGIFCIAEYLIVMFSHLKFCECLNFMFYFSHAS